MARNSLTDVAEKLMHLQHQTDLLERTLKFIVENNNHIKVPTESDIEKFETESRSNVNLSYYYIRTELNIDF